MFQQPASKAGFRSRKTQEQDCKMSLSLPPTALAQPVSPSPYDLEWLRPPVQLHSGRQKSICHTASLRFLAPAASFRSSACPLCRCPKSSLPHLCYLPLPYQVQGRTAQHYGNCTWPHLPSLPPSLSALTPRRERLKVTILCYGNKR